MPSRFFSPGRPVGGCRDEMRVLVCYPPDFSIPTMPFGTLPLFQACLRRAGHEAKVVDLAAFTFRRLIARASVEHHLELLDAELAGARGPLGRSAALARRGLEHLRAIPRELVLGGEAAFERLRDPASYTDPERMLADTRSLFAVDRIYSVLRPRLDPQNPTFTERLYDYLESDPFSPWLAVYEEDLLAELTAFDPELVAVTIPFATQITATMSFAKWVRARLPHARIVVGGTAVEAAEEVLLGDPRFYDYVDFGVTGEGDTALVDLVERLAQDGDVGQVSHLHHRRRGEVVPPRRRDVVDMNESPTYDYRGVDFGLYATPERIACMTTSRGCYYGKCTFCPETLKLGFRRRSSGRTWEDVRAIAVDQGITNFMFWDPLTPPAILEELADRSIAEDVPVRWMAQVKFDDLYEDPAFLDRLQRGGCRWLQFGFESGVQRVLDDMEKGNDLGQMDRILPQLHERGIAVGVFFFIGFPTELEEDARESWRYLVRHSDDIPFAGYLGTFGLGTVVPIYRFPERYGIEIYRTPEGDLAYRRLDGRDWDATRLHESYFARNDQALIEGGAPLMYSVLAPNRMGELTARRTTAPPSFVQGDLRGWSLGVPAHNGFHRAPPLELEDGTRLPAECVAYSGHSQRLHLLDEADLAVVDAVRGGAGAADLAVRAALPATEAAERLARLVDYGLVDARAPELSRPADRADLDARRGTAAVAP